ncbi:hypothetical protein QO004_000100 [Rhizobium mesoamericanum]|uniref:hypothetical protein n=1 Tax=Rhizobium mesoamericanum TaxID=1079800 RepID=UPI0027846BCC|nr:hypothetical protein [Rhizobium mesoamericanum]MDQ0558327.1 hypothetical protein [Rhizobium mesoamericanum]
MRIITEIQEPLLAEVLAFVTLESPADVARVERAATSRMASVRGWFGWRVTDVTVAADADELERLTIIAEPVGGGYRDGPVTYDFLIDQKGSRRSGRLDAFFKACGITERVDDTREIRGRYFSTKNRGRSAADFGPLTNALVS